MEIFTSIETMVKGTVVNRAFPSLHVQSLEITLIVPLRVSISSHDSHWYHISYYEDAYTETTVHTF